MKNKYHIVLILSCFFLMFTHGCKKKKDTTPEPLPVTPTPTASANITISQLKGKFDLNPSQNYKFTADSFLYCMVIADEVQENFYRELFVRDPNGAIRIKLKATSTFVIGDSLKVNIKGAYLTNEFGHVILDSLDASAQMQKISGGANPQPETLTISQITANAGANNSYQSKLVRIQNVEFVNVNYPTFADNITFAAKNHTIQSCSPGVLTVRTRGQALFAGNSLPTGNGSIIGVLNQFNGELQLRVRKSADVSMTGTLCNTIYLNKNFNDNSITSGGWTQQSVSGSVPWTTGTFNGYTFAVCNNYTMGANSPCETWLISPAVNLSSSTNPNLYFQNACNFTGAPLEAYVSTNYSSGLPNTATWTLLSPSLSSGAYLYVNSGALSLNSYKSANTRVAFKYTGSGTDGKAWQVDDIYIKEN